MSTIDRDGNVFCSNASYRPLERVGSGPMAEIHRCSLLGPQGFEKPVAVKKLLPQWTKDPIAVADFIDEARLAALLHHENIVQTYDFGENGGGYFLAMEYLPGKDLQAIMQRAAVLPGGLPVGHALLVAAKISAAMAYAHSATDLGRRPLNLVHRELSPDNIFITWDGKVKVIDFGCARTDLVEERSRMGMIKGQVAYMSPEQLASPAVDRRADIFTIGILLYEMLTGRPMYSGDPATLLLKCRKAEYARLERVAKKLPPAVCAVVDRALQPDLIERYQSCGEMLADLEACLLVMQPRPTEQLLGGFLRRLFAGELSEERLGQPARDGPANAAEEGGYGLIALTAPPAVKAGAAKTPVLGFRPLAWIAAGFLVIILVFSLLAVDIVEEETVTEPVFAPSPEISSPGAAQSELPGTVPSPDEVRKKKIDQLLTRAAEAWKDKRLTEPEKDCAFWYYRRIIALDPKDARAWRGIQRIAGYFGDRVEQALSVHAFPEAERYVQKGLRIFPSDRRLRALSEDVGENRKRYIESLTRRAAQALQRDNLTTPTNDCAYTYYQNILKLDKNNAAARTGMRKIADRYAELAEDAYRNLQIANCRELVRLGLAVSPHHPKLLELQEDLARSMPGIFFKSIEKSLSTMFD